METDLSGDVCRIAAGLCRSSEAMGDDDLAEPVYCRNAMLPQENAIRDKLSRQRQLLSHPGSEEGVLSFRCPLVSNCCTRISFCVWMGLWGSILITTVITNNAGFPCFWRRCTAVQRNSVKKKVHTTQALSSSTRYRSRVVPVVLFRCTLGEPLGAGTAGNIESVDVK